jgi:hypothetical protein
MYALLALSTALCPAVAAQLDESVANALREKYGERMSRCVCALAGSPPPLSLQRWRGASRMATRARPGLR